MEHIIALEYLSALIHDNFKDVECKYSIFFLLERQQLFTQYKIELGDILIPSNAVCLETVIGEGLLTRLYYLCLQFHIGAFGMVCKSVYTNPKTGKSIRVAVKGLKGIILYCIEALQ